MNSHLCSHELSAVWQPLDRTVQAIQEEFRQFETMSAHYVEELGQLQQLVLTQAMECEALQQNVLREQDEKLRWLSRFEQQEAQLARALEELVELRHICESTPAPESEATRGFTFDEQRHQIEMEQLQRELAHARAELSRVSQENDEMREERGRWSVELEYQQREYENLSIQHDELERQQHIQEQRINEELISLQSVVLSFVQRSAFESCEHSELTSEEHEPNESQAAATPTASNKSFRSLPKLLQAQFARIKRDNDRRHRES